MIILTLGLNHLTAPVEIREKLAFTISQLPNALIQLRDRTKASEAVILATCNRVELYIVSDTAMRETMQLTKQFLAEFHQIPVTYFAANLYIHHGTGAVRHLFRVAASLDSMVLGEAQILGQVKEAYELAKETGFTGLMLNALFQRSFTVAKEIRSTTDIGKGAVSVSSVAVELAQKIFGDLHNRSVMIIGAGEMSEHTLRHLVDAGATSVIVSNRNYDRAVKLAESFQGRAVRFDECFEQMVDVDMVISSTGAPRFIIHKEKMIPVMRLRKHRPIFLIDIAVPRDIDPQVHTLDNVYLYNIDNLQQVVNNNLAERQQELAKCEMIIDKELQQFIQWYNSHTVTPIIKKLNTKLETIRQRELQKTLNQLSDLTPEQKEKIAYLTQRIANQILNSPLEQLKKRAATDSGYSLAQAVNDLFELEKETDSSKPQINTD
ncbi:MAG: glutamyl-tRNA reductase [bacterium]|nr:glutamyl-tRNA reductase [bacterium]